MKVRSLRAVGWRNLAPVHLAFDPEVRLNVLSGDNGQGKTNVLEALYYLAAFRSFRTTRAVDLVQRGSVVAHVAVDAQTNALVRTIDVELTLRAGPAVENGVANTAEVEQTARLLQPGSVAAARTVGRSIKLDGKTVRGVARAFGALSVVLFVPEDLMLIRAAPVARRRFVDMAISGVEPAYFAEAAAFQKILRSRNAVLRGGRSTLSNGLLDTYDEQLAQAGARVVLRRRQLISAIAPTVESTFRVLHGDLAVGLTYVSERTVMSAVSESEIREALLAGLLRRRPMDERRGHSTFGPHTDDLEIHLGVAPAREHASQGQMRSLVLAMKLSELANVEARRGEAPVLLLDDVPSELDPTRRQYLFQALAELSCQTVVSVADPNVIPPLRSRADFVVRGGRLSPVPVFPLQSGS